MPHALTEHRVVRRQTATDAMIELDDLDDRAPVEREPARAVREPPAPASLAYDQGSELEHSLPEACARDSHSSPSQYCRHNALQAALQQRTHDPEWVGLTRAVRGACETVAREYVDAGELEPLGAVDWLVNGAGAFEIGGPEGDNGLSGKKLVAQAYGTAVPTGGGATWGKDPRKVDPRGQRMAREKALELVRSGQAREATIWLAW